ncbi:hypothetical protein [Streptomyces sp. NPDC048650]|uniref:hypothetical protein n=1 Tax=Streptomyces sp. NPDC048650 TaxID=3365583 RepID=UPI0037214F68
MVIDRGTTVSGRPIEVRGSRKVAKEIVVFGWNAQFAETALINGSPGIVVAPHGRLHLALAFSVEGDRIDGDELIGDAKRLEALQITVLPDTPTEE